MSSHPPQTPAAPQFFGKYRGKVTSNLDPLGMARLQVNVPDVMGDGTLAWAMPCLPGAGPNVGFVAIPPQDANVWVEFERGDPEYPVWTGGFWDAGTAPGGTELPLKKIWAGENFTFEVLDSPAGGVFNLEIKTPAGSAKLVADGTVLELSFASGKVVLNQAGAEVNNGNLQVLP